MLEPVAGAGGMPRAFLRVGGNTVARQQLGLALALGCERVVCIAHGLAPELIELQHLAEASKVQFHVIPGARPLAGLVTSSDELLVLAEGLFASNPTAAALLEKGQAVLVQPIEQGLAAGFERIDLNHAAAGAMRLPGRLIERIADLPADCDAVSALQRIALQAGISQRPIPAAGQEGLFWTLVRSDEEAHAIEPQWIRQRTADGAPLGPTRWLARAAVHQFGPAMLHAGSGPLTLTIAALVVAVLALGAGWLAWAPLGLGLCAAGWLLRESALLLVRIESGPERPPIWHGGLAGFGWVIDGVIIALAGWGSGFNAGQPAHDRFFPVLMLVALMRILPRVLGPRVSAWLEDRSLLALGLGVTLLTGMGSEIIHVAAVVAALAGIALPGLAKRLTRP